MTVKAFRGASTHSLDDKARLIVPKRFLDLLPPVDSTFVLTASPDGCLLLLDQGAFERISNEIGDDPLDRDKAKRGLRRLILGHAEEVTPDRAGRIVIPEVLRQFMGARADDKDVVVVGTGSSIELWAPARWHGAMAAAGTDFSSFSGTATVESE
jgi:MraZ protein